MTRAEHMAWAKQRALEYADRGEADNCIASMISDLGKHEETKRSTTVAVFTALALCIGGRQPNAQELRKWVEGFN